MLFGFSVSFQHPLRFFFILFGKQRGVVSLSASRSLSFEDGGWLRGPVNRMRAYRVFELLASSCANQLSEGARSDERSFQRRA